MIRAVLFDLDGTLADTALDLGGALNRLLRQKGLPEVPMTAIRPIASHGANGLIQLGANIGRDHPDHAQWRADYLAQYENCFDQETVLFNGINEMLQKLHQQNITWGIITNKPRTFTDRLVPSLNFAVPPACIVSGDTCAAPKPSVLPMHHACQLIGIAPEACLYVGDAERDMQAGRDAGMTTVLAAWGYIAESDRVEDWPIDHTIEHPQQLPELLVKLNG